MMRASLLALGLVASAVNPADAALPECRPESAAVREVRAVALGIIAADNARDIERVLRYYAADAILMPPNEGIVVGREAIRPRYEQLLAAFTPEIEPRVDEACAADGFAFVRGHNRGRLVARDGGEDRALDDAYLMLLRRETDGEWRISHLIWHRASPPKSTR